MQQVYDGLPLDPNAPTQEGVIVEKQERGTVIHGRRSLGHFQQSCSTKRAIDALTLRLRLLAPDMETVQLYWLPLGESYFDEEHCRRCIVRASNERQDLTFSFSGTERERTMLMLRLDPGENPCTMLVESVAFGRW
jgi:hypothetical protein